MIVLLLVAVVVGVVLLRYRDRLHGAFGNQNKRVKAWADVAPGARLMVVEIDGYRVLCGLGKDGIRCMQVLGSVDAGPQA
jgi:hypothetical protein